MEGVRETIQQSLKTVGADRPVDTSVEATTQTDQAATKPQEDPRLATILARERKLREAQRKFTEEKNLYEQQQKASLKPGPSPEEAKARALEELRAKIANDPLEVLSELGLELESLKSTQANVTKTLEQSQTQARQQAVRQITNDVTRLVESNPDFETTKAMNAIPAVVQLIEDTFDQEGILLSVEDAAKQVEDYLVEETLKAFAIPKIKTKLAPPTPEPQVATEKAQPKMQTLSRAQAPAPTKVMSPRERAILAFQGKLNQE
jgi:hypothetical protein